MSQSVHVPANVLTANRRIGTVSWPCRSMAAALNCAWPGLNSPTLASRAHCDSRGARL